MASSKRSADHTGDDHDEVPAVDAMSDAKRVRESSPKDDKGAGDDGSGHAAQDGNGAAKRGQHEPSKVIHLRGLPPDALDQEIVSNLCYFGPVKNMLLMQAKCQALVEMQNLRDAIKIVSQYPVLPLRGYNAKIQYSSHKELSIDSSTPQHEAQTEMAAAVTPVLHVQVLNMVHPVTVDILFQVFSRCGPVQKIITFNKGGVFQALVQMQDVRTAQEAQTQLDLQNIYAGCCTLRIGYSKLPELSVRYNSEKSRDYTNPNLPSGEGDGGAPAGGAYPYGAAAGSFQPPATPLLPQPFSGRHGGMGGMGGGMPGAMGGAMPGAMGMPPPHGMGMAMGAMAMPMGAMAMPGMGASAEGGSGVGTVVLVSNLNEERVDCDILFTLFGVVGDVLRVKILFKKKSTAMIQFREASQANNAVSLLNGVKFFGHDMHVQISKHLQVSTPRGEQESALTKDFTASPMHRFRVSNNASSRNRIHIYPPSTALHISNIPPGVDDQELRDMFLPFGCVNFRRFPNDAKMALIQLQTTDHALQALVALHNYEVRKEGRIRLAFAKQPTV